MQFGLYVRVLDFQAHSVGGLIPGMITFFVSNEDKVFAAKF